MTKIQKLAWAYATLFFAVVIAGYVPGLSKDGLLLGGFKIDPIDDVVHLVSGLWAAYSAWKSSESSKFYFRAFGSFYTLDAFVGFFTGYAIVDLITGNFAANQGFEFSNFVNNLLVNLPHFIIGPLALLIGFVWYKKLDTNNQNLAR